MVKKDHKSVREIHSKRVSTMGRRRFLSVLSGLGISGFAAAHLTKGDFEAAASDEVPIVDSLEHKDPTDPTSELVPTKKMVPADWYDDLQQAEQTYQDANLEANPGVMSTEIRPGKYGGENAYIWVGLDSENEVTSESTSVDSGEIPEEIDGVKIEVGESGVGRQAKAVPVGTRVNTSTSTYGSLSPGRMGRTGKFATNQHVMAGNGKYMIKFGDRIAKVEYIDCQLDLAIGSTLNGYVPGKIKGFTKPGYGGQYTKAGINDLAARNVTVRKRGARTGVTSGKIKTANGYIGVVDEGCSNRGYQVKGTWYSERGDSGGPVFHVSNGLTKILSMNTGFDPLVRDTSYGFGSYHIYDKTGYHFG